MSPEGDEYSTISLGRRERNNRSLSLLGMGLNLVTLLLVGACAIGFWWVRFG
jgi:hypothetical protein